MQIRNVALVGYMRSGKDSVADCLLHLNTYARKLSFASALKVECAYALNSVNEFIPNVPGRFSEDFFNDDVNRLRFRPLLQWWGTEYRRAEDPDYWVKQTERAINNAANAALAVSKPIVHVVTDARFTNELDMLKKHGFAVIELAMDVKEVIDYLSQKGLSRDAINAQLGHESERQWQSYPKDMSLFSTFGNLPRLTTQVVTCLTGAQPDETTTQEITRFFAAKYPQTYGRDPLAPEA